MKRYYTLFYLLFVLLIMGAFAAMAQNDYGLTILGIVAFVFSGVFFIELISISMTKKTDEVEFDLSYFLEMASLGLLSGILAMRVFYIHFSFVEQIFGVAGLVLIIVYVLKAIRSYRMNRAKSNLMALLVLLFHSSIVFYIASMISVAFFPALSEPAGGVAFAFLLLFIVMNFVRKKIMIGGEKVSAFTFVSRFKDSSVVLMILFFMFTGFMGLTKIEVLPKMYSDEFPQVYFKMVNAAETGKEDPIDGKYRHEEFKEKYDEFVNRHSGSDKK